ncbi:MAG TPA: hypothetical protein VG271_12600 [Beijerinckiaceae bacterium]|nr:hypothetical protein [Beijerinckiaceae bacterium]
MRACFVRLVIATVALMACGAASAQSVADFYRGKRITLMVGSDAGSGYDAYARLLSRYMSKYIPGNPTIVIENLSTAGGVGMTNEVADIDAKDGTFIGATQSSVPFEHLLHLLSPDGNAARFDATKLNWLGTMQQDVFVMIGWHDAPAKNLGDLKTKEYIDGAAAPNTDGSIIVPLMNTMLGTKLKLVTGYSGAAGELLAMERGEIDGAAMAYSSAIALRPDLVTSGKYEIMLQMGAAPHADLKEVPFFNDLVKTQDERAILSLIFSKYQMGRPFFVAEEVPVDRVSALRTAFDQTMKDPDLVAEAKTAGIEINPLDGAAVQQLVARLYAEPADIVHRARVLLGKEK